MVEGDEAYLHNNIQPIISQDPRCEFGASEGFAFVSSIRGKHRNGRSTSYDFIC